MPWEFSPPDSPARMSTSGVALRLPRSLGDILSKKAELPPSRVAICLLDVAGRRKVRAHAVAHGLGGNIVFRVSPRAKRNTYQRQTQGACGLNEDSHRPVALETRYGSEATRRMVCKTPGGDVSVC